MTNAAYINDGNRRLRCLKDHHLTIHGRVRSRPQLGGREVDRLRRLLGWLWQLRLFWLAVELVGSIDEDQKPAIIKDDENGEKNL